jgi:hypothetical protein
MRIAAIQPSSMPDEYISVQRGYVVPETGYYLTMHGAVSELVARSGHELEIQKQLEIMKAERDADAKQMARDVWCAKWCLPLSGVGGLILGWVSGFAFSKLIH